MGWVKSGELLVYRAPGEIFSGCGGRLVSMRCLPYGSKNPDAALRSVDWVDLWSVPDQACVVDSRIVNGVLMRGPTTQLAEDYARKSFVQVRLPRFEDSPEDAQWMARHYYGGDRVGYLVQGGKLALQELAELAKGVGMELHGASGFVGRWIGTACQARVFCTIVPTWVKLNAVDSFGKPVCESAQQDRVSGSSGRASENTGGDSA